MVSGTGGALPLRLRDLTLFALIVSESELDELSLFVLARVERSTSMSRSGGPSDFSASEFSASVPAPVDTPSSHFRILFRLSPQFLQLDSPSGLGVVGVVGGGGFACGEVEVAVVDDGVPLGGTGEAGLVSSQPGQPAQSLFFEDVARLTMLLILLRAEFVPVFPYNSDMLLCCNSSGISINDGWYRLVDILYLAMVMTSRILFRNSMAAGGGD